MAWPTCAVHSGKSLVGLGESSADWPVCYVSLKCHCRITAGSHVCSSDLSKPGLFCGRAAHPSRGSESRISKEVLSLAFNTYVSTSQSLTRCVVILGFVTRCIVVHLNTSVNTSQYIVECIIIPLKYMYYKMWPGPPAQSIVANP